MTKNPDEDGVLTKLKAFLYDWGALYGSKGEARILAELLEDEGFVDIAHSIKEGLHDREKTGAGVVNFDPGQDDKTVWWKAE